MRGLVSENEVVIGRSQPHSLRITGWASDRNGHAPAQIIATTNGVITGLGTTGDWRPKKRVANGETEDFVGFTAYAHDVPSSARVELYALPQQGGKAVCHVIGIDSPARVPNY